MATKSALILLLLTPLLITTLLAQNCLEDGITISSQEEIDAFASNYPACSMVEGRLTIQEATNGSITDLSGLSQLTSLGDLVIIGNSALQNLNGLDNLTTIQSSIAINYNTALNSLAALENISNLEESLSIRDNPLLESLEGLNALNTLGSHLWLINNASLQSLSGFENLTHVGGTLRIEGNAALANLSGLDNLITIDGNLELTQNNALTSIEALHSVAEIGYSITITEAPLLVSLNGLQNLNPGIISGDLVLDNLPLLENLNELGNVTLVNGDFMINRLDNLTRLFDTPVLSSVGGALEISSCFALPNLEGLSNLSNVRSLSLANNLSLASLTALTQLTAIPGNLYIGFNDGLVSLAGLDNILTVGNRFTISRCDGLTDLTGLSSLTSVGGEFWLTGNHNLLSMSGMTQLESIGLDIWIVANFELLDLSALGNITIVNRNLEIDGNTSLPSLAGLEALTLVEGALIIKANNSLSDLSGLDNLSQINSTLRIERNENLVNFAGLNNLTSIANGLYVFENYNLQSLTGLEALTSIGAGLLLKATGLQNLSALSALTSVGDYFRLEDNPALASLFGTHNIDFTGASYIDILFNPELTACGQENICTYITGGGDVTLLGNSAACNELGDVLQACFDTIPHTSLIGRVLTDLNADCQENTGEAGIPGWLVQVTSDTFNYAVSTDSLGNYWLPVLEGEYTLNVISPSPFWSSCFVDTTFQISVLGDSITTDFFMQPQGDCPFLDWDVILPPFRICQTRTIVVNYCNNGSLPEVTDGVFSIALDSLLTLQAASIPYTVSLDGLLLFEVDTLQLFECGQFTLDVLLDCEEAMIGDMPCVEVHLLSEELCAPDSLWDGSIITVSGRCENDSIYFELENIGTGGMSEPAQFRVEIVIDDIVLMLEADDYQLPAGALQTLAYETQGQGFRLAADQTPGHPLYTEVSAVIPNCESVLNDSLLTQLPMNDGDPFSGVFCAPATNSYDPNDKNATPAGVGANHEIDKGWLLDYTIRFQNTGNDVAYEVVIKDTLSGNLDLSTLAVKGASHPFSWSLNPARELVFTFENILLPDSTTNEAASHGFVRYTILPKSTILPGETIKNRAGIYFDFNDPIITNTVLHTIRKPVVATSEHLAWCSGDHYNDMLISEDTIVQLLTSFIEYDSIHFVHLDVEPQLQEEIYVDVGFGEYFQDVLIEQDTSFLLTYPGQNGCDSLAHYIVTVITDIATLQTPFSSVEIFPNPSRDILNIRHYQNREEQQWQLINSLGQTVWKTTLAPFKNLPQILTNNIPSGLYILHAKTRSSEQSWKIIVQD